MGDAEAFIDGSLLEQCDDRREKKLNRGAPCGVILPGSIGASVAEELIASVLFCGVSRGTGTHQFPQDDGNLRTVTQ